VGLPTQFDRLLADEKRILSLESEVKDLRLIASTLLREVARLKTIIEGNNYAEETETAQQAQTAETAPASPSVIETKGD
jgi:hypothetical protein